MKLLQESFGLYFLVNKNAFNIEILNTKSFFLVSFCQDTLAVNGYLKEKKFEEKSGAEGDRSPDLPHAKRALYH